MTSLFYGYMYASAECYLYTKRHFVFVCGRLHERINASHYNVSKKNGNQKQLPVAMASVLVFSFGTGFLGSTAIVCVGSDNGRRFRLISFVSWFALKQISPSQEVYKDELITVLLDYFSTGSFVVVRISSNNRRCLSPTLFIFTFSFCFMIVLKTVSQSLLIIDDVKVLYSSKHNRCFRYQLQQHAGLPNHWNSANLLFLRTFL